VIFDQEYKKQITDLMEEGQTEEHAKKNAPIIKQAQEMLLKWEAGDPDTRALWEKMNGWVYDGFAVSYKNLGVDFDKIYYESQTYLLGKKMVEDGVNSDTFFRKEDGSVWVDLTAEGLDQKVLLRADGTSVYITQDIGTAQLRFDENTGLEKLIYVVGNEQDYHFKVLFLILKKLGYTWAEGLYHLSYGMVELPEGKMKSREGKVVDADDLIKEMINVAGDITRELGKIEGLTEKEAEELYNNIGLGALKYFILKVDPKKKMLFNPKESIDFNGHTGPFIQYTYVRTQSILKKAGNEKIKINNNINIQPKEKEIIKLLYEFAPVIKEAADKYNPAIVANYVYELAKEYNQFYHDFPVLKEENESVRSFRIALSKKTGEVIKTAMNLLGINMPDKM